MNQIALKNLQGLNEVLDAEKLTYEKLDNYMSLVQDGELKTLVAELKDASEKHYNTVYSYLKSHQG